MSSKPQTGTQGQTNQASRERETPVLGQSLEAGGRAPFRQPGALFLESCGGRGRAEGRLAGPIGTPAGRHPVGLSCSGQVPESPGLRQNHRWERGGRVGWRNALGGSPRKQIPEA